MPKTFVTGDPLPASDLNSFILQPGTSGTGTRAVAGTTAYTITAANAVSVTISYGFTFSAAPKLLLTVGSGSNIPLLAYMNGTNTTTTAGVRVENVTGSSVTISGLVHWLAIGAP